MIMRNIHKDIAMTTLLPIYSEREVYSTTRLNDLQNFIGKTAGVSDYPNLTVFGAGSFARYEASEYSDIDIFFLCKGAREKLVKPHTRELFLFGNVLDTITKMGFPELSNDCEYLKILHSPDILENMGKPTDDHENYFTVRMLLLLESKCLFGETNYNDIINEIISSYFRDYPDRKETFRPIFLLNDICRFWKTLLMNYESKRGGSDYTEEQKTKQKVRNFKLKFSRMTTCFASIASICSYTVPIKEEQIIEQIRLTPRQRLESIPHRMPEAEDAVQDVLNRYADFLDKTGLPIDKLESHFSDKEKRIEMFRIADEYGDSMYRLLQKLDNCQNDDFKFIRYLVI
jgi:predicted nucleotidyltransferase